MMAKRGFVLLILVTFLFTVVSVNAQPNYHRSTILPAIVPFGSFWIWSTPYVIYHSATNQRWTNWTASFIENTSSGASLPAGWVAHADDLNAVYRSASTFATQENESFNVGYLATYLCCNSQTGQCPSNAASYLYGGGSQLGQWLCGWRMQPVSP